MMELYLFSIFFLLCPFCIKGVEGQWATKRSTAKSLQENGEGISIQVINTTVASCIPAAGRKKTILQLATNRPTTEYIVKCIRKIEGNVRI